MQGESGGSHKRISLSYTLSEILSSNSIRVIIDKDSTLIVLVNFDQLDTRYPYLGGGKLS